MSSNMLEWIRRTPLSEVVPGVWYPGYLDGLPDLYVGRLPPALATPEQRFRCQRCPSDYVRRE